MNRDFQKSGVHQETALSLRFVNHFNAYYIQQEFSDSEHLYIIERL